MKYYSETLNKLFNSPKELEKAEQQHKDKLAAEELKAQQLKEARSTRAKEVEEAFKKANEASKEANRLLNEFLQDYGTYHTTIRDAVPTVSTIWEDMFSRFFN